MPSEILQIETQNIVVGDEDDNNDVIKEEVGIEKEQEINGVESIKRDGVLVSGLWMEGVAWNEEKQMLQDWKIWYREGVYRV